MSLNGKLHGLRKTKSARDSVMIWTETIQHYPKVKSRIICSKFCQSSLDPSLEVHDQDTCFKYHALKHTVDSHLKCAKLAKDRNAFKQHQNKVKKEEKEKKLKEVADRVTQVLLKFEERE